MNNRTYEFCDIFANIDKAQGLSGLEFLQKMQTGTLKNAPATDTLALYISTCEWGKVEFEFLPADFHFNAVGTVHGGVISTILDSAMGCSLLSTLDANTTFTTLELKVNFLRAVTLKTSKLHTQTKVIHAGRTTAMIESSLVDEQGKIYAHGVSTCLKMNKK